MTGGARQGDIRYAHLMALTDDRGIFEHALLDVPRVEEGYCTDDAARALIVVLAEDDADPVLHGAAHTYMTFLERALSDDGLCRNRLSAAGEFTDDPGDGDWWGRAVQALGTAAAGGDGDVARRGRESFAIAARTRSPHLRAMVFAGLGAAAVLSRHPDDTDARGLLSDAVAAVPSSGATGWIWPEPRLTYANAAIPELLIAAASALGSRRMLARGIRLLRFLLDVESAGARLSVTGTGGRGPHDASPQFDQQPIEVGAIADACVRALEVTGDPNWLTGVDAAWAWFEGRNDAGVPMFDARSGAGYDGLEPAGRNENRGAESTIAALRTAQHARRCGVLDPQSNAADQATAPAIRSA